MAKTYQSDGGGVHPFPSQNLGEEDPEAVDNRGSKTIKLRECHHTSAEASALEIKRFLVVDQNEESRQFVKSLLWEMRYQDITLATSGEEALSLIEPKRIEFIIFFWELEPMTGPAFAQRVQSFGAFRHIPMLIYTKKITQADIQLMKEIGLSNVMPYPIPKDDMITAIKDMTAAELKLDPIIRKLRQASGFLDDGQITDANNLTIECLHEEGYVAQSHCLLGNIHIKKEEFKQAEGALGKSLDRDQKYTPALQSMSKVYSRTNRHQMAIKILKKLTEKSPLNINSLLNLGSAYVAADQHDDARETFDKAAAIDKDNPRLKEEMGTLAFKEGKFAVAKELIAGTLNKEEMARNFNYIAIGLIANKKFEDGINSYVAAIDILGESQQTFRLYYNLGLAWDKKGDLKKAFDNYCKCFFMCPSFEKAYLSIAKVVNQMLKRNMDYDKDTAGRVKATWLQTKGGDVPKAS